MRGRVESGRREAARFLNLGWVERQLAEKLGYPPFPGTLNVRLADAASLENWRRLREGEGPHTLASPDPAFCDARLYPVTLNSVAPCHVVVPCVPGYYEDVVELIAPESLRNLLRLSEGSECVITTAPPAVHAKSYSTVLFDFEGTLVDFQWKLAEAESELRGVLASLGFDLAPFASDNYAQLRTRAIALTPDPAVKGEIDRRFGDIYDRYDQDALTRWTLKPGAFELLDSLARRGAKVALVSNVGRLTLTQVIKKLGIDGRFNVIVTRNEVENAKPSGEGLKKAMAILGSTPAETIMIGDSMSDLWASRDAGTDVAIILGGESPTPQLTEAAPEHIVDGLAPLRAIL